MTFTPTAAPLASFDEFEAFGFGEGESPESESSIRIVAKDDAPSPLFYADDLPEQALIGRLGDICNKFMLPRFPVGIAWLALVAMAGASLTVARNACIPTNLFTALVGPVNCGKSTAIKWAKQMVFGVEETEIVMETMAGSAEGLAKELSANGASRLYSPDELAHLLLKAQIDGATFGQFLCRAFYQPENTIIMARQQKAVVNCRLGIIGGLVTDAFDESFGSTSVHGLYDRFLFAQHPNEFAFNFAPCPAAAIGCVHTVTKSLGINPDVFEWQQAYIKEYSPESKRVVELALRVAAICATFDGKTVLQARDLDTLHSFIEYQNHQRKMLKPNMGTNADSKMFFKFKAFLESQPAGAWVSEKALFDHTNAFRLGIGQRRVLDVMQAQGMIDRDVQTHGDRAGRPKKVVRWVG